MSISQYNGRLIFDSVTEKNNNYLVLDKKLNYNKYEPIWRAMNKSFISNIYNTCAVVGSSFDLLNSEYGKEIDRHDIVIRFNHAITRGYEEYVGSKTDYRINGKSDLFREKNEVIIHRYNKEEYIIGDILNYMSGRTNFYFFNFCFLNYMRDLIAERNNTGTPYYVPSSGFLGAMFAWHISKKVDIYGFGIPFKDKYKKYHYYDNENNWEGNHPYKIEYGIYDEIKEINRRT